MSDASPNSSISTPKRLGGMQMWLVRLAWVILLLLAAAKIALGQPVKYAEMSQPCLAAEENCSESDALTPRQVQELEAAGLSLAAYAKIGLAWFVLTTLVWSGIGVFIFMLRPDDRLAWIASAMMIIFPSQGLESQVHAAHPVLGTAADLFFNLGNLLMFFFIAWFPNGRFAPHWMRWYWLGTVLINILPKNLWLLSPEISNILIGVFWLSFLVLGPYSQIHRYRHGSSVVERLQTKWVVFGFALFAGGALVGFAVESLLPENSLAYILQNAFYFDLVSLLIPLSIGFSVLRYRLWDIDLVIRRTLQYTLLTLLLALAYFGGVVLLQGVLGPLTGQADSPLVAVLTTLGVAALFNPLRRRIQEFIDRRFYRQKYDAEQALAGFAAAARNETNLVELSTRLTDVVQETLQPEQVRLWVRKGISQR